MARIGIIGGGPGGLMTAYLLRKKYGSACRTTVLEASGRLGGKLLTRSFATAPVPYEAGAAEVYDYSAAGHDPMRDLVDELGLATRPMHGQTVILDGTVLRTDADIARHWGEAALAAIRDFRARVAELLPLERWHPGSWRWDRAHPWSRRTCRELLDTVADPVARRYLTVAAHSDLATEPHLTSGLNGLQNFVMDVPGYLDFYAIEGGMGRLAERLAAELGDAEVCTEARVVRIERSFGDGWRVRYAHGGDIRVRDFDAVVLALPASQLGTIDYSGEPLRAAMQHHIAHFDRPGHYLRASLLFRSPFWRDALSGSWFMVDGFGGACVYDESARYDTGSHGVLGFLLAGNDALSAINLDDDAIVRRVLESLPPALRHDATRLLLEARVHRWCGGVSGQPGGLPLRDPEVAHQPDAARLPGLLAVGDYLFDSTLNAVLRSAELATTLLASRVGKEEAVAGHRRVLAGSAVP